MNGWIKLYRKLLNWEWSDDPNTGWLFMICLMSANHIDNKWHGLIIKKGSFLTSQPHLAKKTGLSVMQVRTSLNKLKLTGELTVKTTNKYTVISIQNWNKYQQDNRQPNSQITGKQQASNRQVTTNKNIKNDKNIKKREYSSLSDIQEKDFEEISLHYKVPLAFVRSKYDDLVNYCGSKGKHYKNYRLALMDWVKKDSIKLRKEANEHVSKRGIDARGVR